ncbi:MAG TPA: glycosyltransferase [Actinomycetota bacterium]
MVEGPARPDLSLVLPAYNEEARIRGALEQFVEFSSSSGLSLELIVADDGSSDATADAVLGWRPEAHPSPVGVRVVRIAHRGKGAAVRAGMSYAGAGRAPVVGYCDVDLSAGVDALERMYRELTQGSGRPGVVIASRGLKDSVLEVRQPWYRERAGRMFNVLLRRASGIVCRDTQCGLKLFRREVALEIFRHQRVDGFAFDAEVIVLAVRLGISVVEVPVRWCHCDGSKVSFVRDGFAMCRDTVRIVRGLRPGKVHALGIPTTGAMQMMAASEDVHWWHVAKRRLVGGLLERHAPAGPCLDVGCGAGAMVAHASRARCAVGVDLSNEALAHARSRGLTRLVRSEAGTLPFASGSFGAALALDVIEHHAAPEKILGEIRRVLGADGLLVVTVPAFQWMWSYADHVLGHYRRYTKQHLVRELEEAGFDVARVTYVHSWLLPAAWTFRKIRGLVGRTDTADDFALPGPMNRLLLGISRLELRLLGSRDLPFGLSVLGLARPAAAPSREAGRAPATSGAALSKLG